MALHDEHADILGGPILQRPEAGLFATFSQYHFVFKSFTFLGLSLLVWIACARGLEHLKKHRELRYRKAMRRKHGIPDSDCRPFAVAYAAAKRAHLEREAQDRKKTTNYVSDHNSPAVDQRTHAQKDARGLRRRVPETTVQLHDYQLSGKHASLYDKRPEVHSLDFADRYNPNPRHRVAVPETLPGERPYVRRASRKDLVINIDDHEESRKRSFEGESDVEHETIKKSRIDGHEFNDGYEQADWYAQYSDIPARRASKEALDRQPEVGYVHTNGQESSKRVSDLGDEDHEPIDEIMEDIDEDEVTELKAVARGKKRDRAEAGSSFGGDDEEDIRNGRASHYRKRRTILRRAEIPARGQKRDRGAESPESEGEGGGSETSRRGVLRSFKKTRGKKTASDDVSETSAEDSRVSKDPLCGGRRVGDEWEADGVQYKVGAKGERLRLILVKKARNKYHMPQDSQHPDRSAALEIYVETWMTEEQYKQAEGRQELAWQEAPRSKTPDVLDSPTQNGKKILWDSVKVSPTRRPFRQFIPVGASTRINPFEQWQLQPNPSRRVASSSTILSPILPGVADSPTRPGFRGFSKWEKQDREAEALTRIRAKIEEQKRAQGPPQKSAEMPTSVTAPELGTKPLPVPTITLTPVPAVAAEGKSDDSTSPSKSNTSTFFLAAPPSTIKGAAAASTTTPGFSLPSASIGAATPSTLSPSAPIAPITIPSTISLSPFSFAKPQHVPSSTSTTASSSAMPNFFGKETGTGIPPSSTPLPSTLGATTQPQPPSTESASKPATFFFAKPDTSSSTPSPAVVPPSTTKSQVPAFGAISSSSPSPAIISSTPAAAKAEALVRPPVSTTSESSKPTIPLFSFSGASLSSSTATHPTSSTSSAPKFSFGQPSTTSTSTPGFNLAPATASQLKTALKFGQTPDAMNGASVSTLPVDESKKSAVPVSVFSTAAGSNEPVKPSPFGTSTFGSSTFSSLSASTTNLFGKPVPAGSDASISTPPKPTLASTSTTAFNTFSSTPAGAPASGNAPMFSFVGTGSGSKSVEGSKPASLFGGAAGGPKPVSMFGGSSTESKPTFTFSASAEGSKPTPMFGGSTESSKPPSVFGGSAEGSKPTFAFGGSVETPKPVSVFGGAVEGPKSTFAFSGTTENKSMSGPVAENSKSTALFTTPSDSSLPSNTPDASKSASIPGSTTFGSSSPVSALTFGKDNAATNISISTSTQSKPATSFAFGIPSGATGSIFGQPSAFVPSGDSSQSVFGKPTNTTPNAFGFAGTGGSGSSSAFTFGKPATQNQKQEQ
ncbi:hypothetical protein J3R82DRAFT_4134 [Butyriboletus roseoflavus]|nr:hypothetical protein J3R82DRAFT_4134 [Butyriboletus roseoflavus]